MSTAKSARRFRQYLALPFRLNTPWEIGKIYLIRSVTKTNTGRLVAVYKNELVLQDAAWIADTGRFADALASAEFAEVEPYPKGSKVIVGRGAIEDAVQIASAPTKQS